jgi:hypothetical protein
MSRMCERADQERITAIREMLAERTARLEAQRELSAVLAQKAGSASPFQFGDSSFWLSTVSGFSDVMPGRQTPSTPHSDASSPPPAQRSSSLYVAPYQEQLMEPSCRDAPKMSRQPHSAEASVSVVSAHYLCEAPRSAPADNRVQHLSTAPPFLSALQQPNTAPVLASTPATSSQEQPCCANPQHPRSSFQPRHLSPTSSAQETVDSVILPTPPDATGETLVFSGTSTSPAGTQPQPSCHTPPQRTATDLSEETAEAGASTEHVAHSHAASCSGTRAPHGLVATRRRWLESPQGPQTALCTPTQSHAPPAAMSPSSAQFAISPPTQLHLQQHPCLLTGGRHGPETILKNSRSADARGDTAHSKPPFKVTRQSQENNSASTTTPPAALNFYRFGNLRVDSASASPPPPSTAHIYKCTPTPSPTPRPFPIVATSDSFCWLQPTESQYLCPGNGAGLPSDRSSSGDLCPHTEFRSFSTDGESSFLSSAGTSGPLKPPTEFQSLSTADESSMLRPAGAGSAFRLPKESHSLSDSGDPEDSLIATKELPRPNDAGDDDGDFLRLGDSGCTTFQFPEPQSSSACLREPMRMRLEECGYTPCNHHPVPLDTCTVAKLDGPHISCEDEFLVRSAASGVSTGQRTEWHPPCPFDEGLFRTRSERSSSGTASDHLLLIPAEVSIIGKLKGLPHPHSPLLTRGEPGSEGGRVRGQENSSAAGNASLVKGFGLLRRLRHRG